MMKDTTNLILKIVYGLVSVLLFEAGIVTQSLDFMKEH